jgi:tellurite resistance protein
MEFRIPTPQQLEAGLRAIKTVAEVDGPLNKGERALLTAASRALGGGAPIDALAPITPEQLAAAVDDRQIRWQLTGALVVTTLADGDVDQEEAALVQRFARAMQVEDPSVENMRRLAQGQLRLARLDILRRQWAPRKIREIAAAEGAGTYWKALLGVLRIDDDPALSARYRALERAPAGSLGRGYYDFVIANGFPFAGEKGAAPEVIAFHDMTHVLAGYATTPQEEILAAAFSAGYSREENFNWLMFVLSQFQLGIHMAPGVEPEYDMMNPARMIAAIRRGAAMNLDLNVGWSYWDVINEPVEELRIRYNILPEEQFLPGHTA